VIGSRGLCAGKLRQPIGRTGPCAGPDTRDIDVAAAAVIQGFTTSHIVTRFYETRDGDVALINAAAGGLGSLLTGLEKIRGGTVIGRV
jgi:NADPH:quinone reductase